VGQGVGGETGLNVRSSSRVDDEFYQGIFDFQITIINFIMRKYAAKRHEQGLPRPRIFTICPCTQGFLALFAMPQWLPGLPEKAVFAP
jgi:hypothetical protein